MLAIRVMLLFTRRLMTSVIYNKLASYANLLWEKYRFAFRTYHGKNFKILLLSIWFCCINVDIWHIFCNTLYIVLHLNISKIMFILNLYIIFLLTKQLHISKLDQPIKYASIKNALPQIKNRFIITALLQWFNMETRIIS